MLGIFELCRDRHFSSRQKGYLEEEKELTKQYKGRSKWEIGGKYGENEFHWL